MLTANLAETSFGQSEVGKKSFGGIFISKIWESQIGQNRKGCFEKGGFLALVGLN